MKVGVCTIISKNHLTHARVLMSAVQKSNPELQRFVIVADVVDGYINPEQEDFTIILSSHVPVRQSQWFHFKYNVFELSNALKPYVLDMLFEDYQLDGILYFDSDIRVCRRLTPSFDALEQSDIVLTPHLTEPMLDDGRPLFRSGVQSFCKNVELPAREPEWVGRVDKVSA